MLDKLLEYIIELLKNKDKKGLKTFFLMIIEVILFISPGFMYLFLYEKDTLINTSFCITSLLVLIIDVLLYILIFLCMDVVNVEIKPDSIEYQNNIEKRIFNTELIMAIISVVLIFIYLVPYFIHKDIKTKLALGTVIMIIGVLVLRYFNMRKKFIKELKRQNEREEKLKSEVCQLNNNKSNK